MLKQIRVIPCLLLGEQGLVKTIKFHNPQYVGDPINVIKIFNDKKVDELLLLDITATIENHEPLFKKISQITSECFMPLGYGGGIKKIEDIKKIFRLGVEKIVINSYAVENPYFIKNASAIFGSQSIVVSIDVKKKHSAKYEIFIYGGTRATGIDPETFATTMEKMGAGELLLTSIDVDGTGKGYDIELIQKVSQKVTIPVIACGGAGKITDFTEAVKNGASAVAAASMFVFHGKHRAVLINYPDKNELATIKP